VILKIVIIKWPVNFLWIVSVWFDQGHSHLMLILHRKYSNSIVYFCQNMQCATGYKKNLQPQFYNNVFVFSMAQLKKTGAAGGTDFFEMNLPHCLLANVVKTEMEAVGSNIQVKNFCSVQCAPFLHVTIYIQKNVLYCCIRFYNFFLSGMKI
jgi:hypothetical protein